jgi:hypothetical protein
MGWQEARLWLLLSDSLISGKAIHPKHKAQDVTRMRFCGFCWLPTSYSNPGDELKMLRLS